MYAGLVERVQKVTNLMIGIRYFVTLFSYPSWLNLPASSAHKKRYICRFINNARDFFLYTFALLIIHVDVGGKIELAGVEIETSYRGIFSVCNLGQRGVEIDLNRI